MECLISAVSPQQKKKDRYNIFIDGEYAASLGAEACVRFGIREGASVDEQTIRAAVAEDNTQYAFDCALAFLAHKMRTSAEVTARLKEKGLCEEAVSAALEKLSGYGYIDDAAYAREYVQSAITAANYGKKAIEYKLKAKGVPDDVIRDALPLYTADVEKDIVGKKLGKYKNEDKRKAISALVRHGFDYEIVRQAMSEETGFEI